ncbi:NADH-quinone oxidoreductase subunit L [Peptococcus simiae]|uniref:NADH-quinone oxidoreductase subunit L n=1 Tax=Peptococcus simiae TaxID=1643805 RepID=A0ABW9H0C7_9FIRM
MTMNDTWFWINLAWLLPIIPLVVFAVTGLFTQKNKPLTLGLVIGSFAVDAVIATGIAYEVYVQKAATMLAPIEYGLTWIKIPGLTIDLGVLMDPLTAMMLFVVTVISLLVSIYSIGYMEGDPGTPRFFTYLSVFVASMLILVLANNYFMIFIGWELVGLCSYLLIGFYYQTFSAAAASQKAFLFNRIADFGFMVGFFLLFAQFGTFNFTELAEKIPTAEGTLFIAIAGILVFVGPIGKSAQFPFHVWLPDAMEGPTPVSALIHAATMVAAGVYLLSRQFVLFQASEAAMTVVLVIGAFTSIFAASMALVNNDIKRVLAFSTLSQLGYMVMAVGLGSMTAAMFHLGTHAFFKALLFLGAGCIIHVVGSNDMSQMGGLRKHMPKTTWTFLIGTLALCGIVPFAGFWSKDEIIATAFTNGHYFTFVIAEVVAFMTSFYMFRLVFRTFFGENKTDKSRHLHECPATMTTPLIVLAVFAIFGGFVGAPFIQNGFASYIFYGQAHHPEANWFVICVSTIMALGGIFLAYLIYYKKAISAEAIAHRFSGIYTILYNRYYVDEFYGWVFHKLVLGFSKFCKFFDEVIIDGFLDFLATVTKWGGSRLRRTETGNLQTYALVMFAAVIILVLWKAIPMLGGI